MSTLFNGTIGQFTPKLWKALAATAAATLLSTTGAHANNSGVPGIGGGGSGGASGATPGGAGGRDDSTAPGGAGQPGVTNQNGSGGGGGGGAGTVGGVGGFGENGGGIGGNGGAHARVAPTFGGSALTGGSGAAGGNGLPIGIGGGGGGGGAGGYGVVVSGIGDIGTLTTTITGGNGGAGGAAGGPSASGGNGGSGGVGLFFAGNGATSATINGNVTGGNGGAGGAGSDGFGGGLPGNSGAAGVGIVARGGVTLTIGATVSGGSSPGLIRGDALRFIGGDNTITLAPGFGLIGAINVQSGTLTFNQPNSITLDPRLETIFQRNVNEIIGDGAVRFQGAGTVTLNAENFYTGGTQLNGGNVALGNLSALGTGTVFFTGGTSSNLGFNVSGTFGQDIAVDTGSEGIITAATGQTVTLAGGLFLTGNNSALVLGGPSSGNLIVGVSGSVASYGVSSTTNIVIAGGQVTAGNRSFPDILANAQNVSVHSGAILNLNDQTDPAQFLGIGTLLGGGTIITGTNAATIVPVGRGFFGGVISGAGGLRVTDIGASLNGTLILTGANTYTGTTIIDADHTLQLGGNTDDDAMPGSTGSLGSGAVINNGTLAVNRSNQVTLSGIISGTGVLNQIGAGTTILTGANTYTGATTISAGTLQIGNGGTTGQLGTALSPIMALWPSIAPMR